MRDATFKQLVEQVDTMSYFQRMTLLKKIVSSFEASEKRREPAKAEFCDDAFGIWKDAGISLAEIRSKAWR